MRSPARGSKERATLAEASTHSARLSAVALERTTDAEALLCTALACAQQGRIHDTIRCLEKLCVGRHAYYKWPLGLTPRVEPEAAAELLLKRGGWFQAAGLRDEAQGAYIQAAELWSRVVDERGTPLHRAMWNVLGRWHPEASANAACASLGVLGAQLGDLVLPTSPETTPNRANQPVEVETMG